MAANRLNCQPYMRKSGQEVEAGCERPRPDYKEHLQPRAALHLAEQDWDNAARNLNLLLGTFGKEKGPKNRERGGVYI